MSGTGVLRVDPTQLRVGCRMLREAAAELEALGARVLSAGPGTDAWSGLAALEHQARVQALHTLISSAGGPPQVVAVALERCADEAEVAAAQVRTWDRVGEEALAQAGALRAAGTPPEPGLEQVWRRRLAELDEQERLAARRTREAEEEYAAAQQRAATVLEQAWSTWQDLESLRKVSVSAWTAIGYTMGVMARLVLATDAALASSRARRTTGERTRARADQRARTRLRQLRAVSTPGASAPGVRLMTLTPGPVGLAFTLLGAARDVHTGGGYQGWRGHVTRALAGAALAGVPMLFVGPLLPPAPLIGMGLITSYAAWSAGNAVWDGRGTVLRYARRLGAGVATLRGRAVEALRRSSIRMRQVRLGAAIATGRLVQRAGERMRATREAVGTQVRESAAEVLGRLPGAEATRARWRDLGQPIRLPRVPLGPVLRAPVDLGRWSP